MKKKFLTLIIIMTLLGSIFFTSCSNQMLYGSWQLIETINAETGQGEAPMFANMMVFTINKDKTVTFLDKEYGKFTKSRNEFHFEQTSDIGEKMDVSGAWEIIGSELFIYPDDLAVQYHFVKVQKQVE